MRRSFLFALAVCASALCGTAYSENEEKTGYIEDTQIIINASSGPNGEAGVILALPCAECPSRRFTYNRDTVFILAGAPVEFRELGGKIDWRGMIIFPIADPTRASKVFLRKPESP
ncbi:hypothetical protein [Pseudomonas knackmussii]|uniref:hypothetical protein n=1 Tax=Pseudomonas knackmussii TaxID=65741 RepID=UPI0013635952|nr:hypothetical protein [Pseudomonas knackmussii]